MKTKTVLFFLFLICFILSLAYASEITVVTGYGYYVNGDGHVTDKAELSPGQHQLTDGFTYVEIADKEELNQIEVYVPPVEDTEGQVRADALSALIDEKIASTPELQTRETQMGIIKIKTIVP